MSVQDPWSNVHARRPRPIVYSATPKYPRGTYVLATKYSDGDPGDQWCVGFYFGQVDHFGDTRHDVVDSAGFTFRHNGFRRVERISPARGNWIVRNMDLIQRSMDRLSVWHWFRAPWAELNPMTDAARGGG